MSQDSAISWCDDTFNPWWGCARVSPACRSCYADTWAIRTGNAGLWRRHGPRRTFGEQHWREPLKMNARAEREGRPRLVFCASMADVFEDHPQLPPEREKLWELVGRTPNLRWLLLTKRPENVMAMAPWSERWPENVWVGTSVENQEWADERIPILLEVPAVVRFLSCEPLLGPVDLRAKYCRGCPDCSSPSTHIAPGIDWIIGGGESGKDPRPTHPDWARSLRDQAVGAEVAFHWKQWGAWRPGGLGSELMTVLPDGSVHDPEDAPGPPFRRDENPNGALYMSRVGKKAAGRELDGRTWDERPAVGATVAA